MELFVENKLILLVLTKEAWSGEIALHQRLNSSLYHFIRKLIQLSYILRRLLLYLSETV